MSKALEVVRIIKRFITRFVNICILLQISFINFLSYIYFIESFTETWNFCLLQDLNQYKFYVIRKQFVKIIIEMPLLII